MYSIAHILQTTAAKAPDTIALIDGNKRVRYGELASTVGTLAGSLLEQGLEKGDRIAVYLDTSIESVVTIFAACLAGLIVVPVNPKLKPHQLQHILVNSGAGALVTSRFRLAQLSETLRTTQLRAIWLTGRSVVGSDDLSLAETPVDIHRWEDSTRGVARVDFPRTIDIDPTAILYTSGSTGNPKGVVVSHRNLVEGARSVNRYLETTSADVILSILPLSFDAGLSQLTTGTLAGATVVLHSFMRAAETAALCARERVTSITGVPPLWSLLSAAPWPQEARNALRLFATTGGHMPAGLLKQLRELFPRATPFLMYGLTEAFRSTYLDPSEADRRPGSIGKSIPNAEILVLREDGTRCNPGETGELVHRGAHVTLGYWNNPTATAERFAPLPQRIATGLLPEYAVWSGDFVKLDADGFIYFVGRRDEMIKSSGYRISPSEVEDILYAAPGVREAAVIGLPAANGDSEVLGLVVANTAPLDIEQVRSHCARNLPSYMTPRIVEVDALPRSPNGKIDRVALRAYWSESGARSAAAVLEAAMERA